MKYLINPIYADGTQVQLVDESGGVIWEPLLTAFINDFEEPSIYIEFISALKDEDHRRKGFSGESVSMLVEAGRVIIGNPRAPTQRKEYDRFELIEVFLQRYGQLVMWDKAFNQ